MSEAGKKSTRKEKRKAELSAKMDKTLAKLELIHTRAATAAPDAEDRHDPKHASGTFWKERKEKKKRTLFVGGLPGDYRKAEVEALIDSIEGGENSVESVDFVGSKLPKHKRPSRQNAFVTFTTLDAAMAAQQGLDKLRVGDSNLRVNFSADSSQRAVAIAKREGNSQKQNFARRSR